MFTEVEAAIAPRTNPVLEPATIRSRMVQVDTRTITAARRGREVLKLNLFDDAAIDVEIKRVRPTRTGYFISGTPRGMQWGDVRLVVNGPVMVGTVESPEGKFTIRSAGSNRHIIRQIDPAKEQFECEQVTTPHSAIPSFPPERVVSSIDPPLPQASAPAIQADDEPSEDGSEVRVLVVYTASVQARQGGPAGMRTLIDFYVQSANQAFEESGIRPRLVLAHSALVNYVAEEPRIDLRRLHDPYDGYMDEVHTLRNQHAADLVHLLTDARTSVRGIAYLLRRETLSYESHAFALTAEDNEKVFTHEIGHNFGAVHDRFVQRLEPIYPFAYGYVNEGAFTSDAPETAKWFTVMAYDDRCGNAGIDCERLLRFSNPEQSYFGDPLGVPADSGAAGVDGPSDARLTLNNTARWVSSLRSEACTDFAVTPEAPIAPVGGGEIGLKVDTAPGCLWEGASRSGFLTVMTETKNAGPGILYLQVDANQTGAERSGTVTVAGKSIDVLQLANDQGICHRTSSVVLEIMESLAGSGGPRRCDEVDANDLASVSYLNFSRGGIRSLRSGDFAGLSHLTRLDLTDNALTELPEDLFADLTSLEELWLYRNQLTQLPEGLLAGLSNLRIVSFEINKLTEVPAGLLKDVSNLEILNLSQNRLTEVPAGLFFGLSKLQYLYLDENGIKRLHEGLFSDLASLHHLDLDFNQFAVLTGGVFSGLSGLRTLRLATNNLEELPAGLFSHLTSLEDLNLSFNRLEDLREETFSGLSSLQYIRLDANSLSRLPAGLFAGLSGLEEIDLSFNRLVDLPQGLFVGLSSLEKLDLRRNRLTSLPAGVFDHTPELQSLFLSFNRLNALPAGSFVKLYRLRLLDLYGNSLTQLPSQLFSGLSALETLYIGGNHLSSMPANVFSGLDSLTHLSLTGNRLDSLPDGIFSGLTNLDTLRLGSNAIDPLPLAVSLQKVGENQFKAIAPSGAPFLLVLPIAASDEGVIQNNASSLTIPAGALESESVDLARTSGSEKAISVNFGSLPALPAAHIGYELYADESLPRIILGSIRPDDAMLIGISLSEGELSPGFSAGTNNYTAVVANDVGRITIGVTKSNKSAGVKFRGTAEMELPDADASADGHQVDLLVGENAINVMVTSQDGTVADTYELVVTRDGTANGCVRSEKVREAILSEVPGAEACGELTTEHLSSILALDLSNQGIASLTKRDFTGLVSLQQLRLTNNQLSSLPHGVFSDLNGMQQLWLDNNKIRELHADVFSNLTVLRELALSENSLVVLPSGVFSDLAELRNLWLWSNQLSTLPVDVFEGITSLSSLFLYDNKLTNLPLGLFSDTNALRELNMADNLFASLRSDTFSDLTSLRHLNLRRNRLTDIPNDLFADLSALESINLSNNDLANLRPEVFSGLTLLRELRLDDISLTELSADFFARLRNLRVLTLSRNELGQLHPGVFSGMGLIEILDLSKNRISSLDAGVFSDLTSLTGLLLSGNRLRELPAGIFSGLAKLRRLELNRNPVDPMPLPVSLEKEGESQFRAVAPTGAPFRMDVAIGVNSAGAIDGDASALAIPAGGTESVALNVTRVAGSELAVTVDIDSLPALPERHIGYVLREDETLPRVILPGAEAPPTDQVTNVEVTAEVEQLLVSWDALSNANGYKVQWKSGEEDYDESRQAVVTGGDVENYTITGLTAGAEYTIRVIATMENAKNGEPSEDVTGIPKAQPPAQVIGVAVVAGFEQLQVSWEAVSDASGYKVQWKSGAQDYSEDRQVALLGSETTSYTIVDLNSDTEYTIRVIATKDHADDGEHSEEVTASPATTASPDPDVNADGTLDGDDAQVMYQAYASAAKVGDGESGGTPESRRRLLSGLAGVSDPTDDDLKAMLRKANVWRSVGLAHGGDINEDGAIDGDDAFVMYYAYEFADLVGNGQTGGTARHRRHLLASRAGQDEPTDADLKKMLRRANKLKEDFG